MKAPKKEGKSLKPSLKPLSSKPKLPTKICYSRPVCAVVTGHVYATKNVMNQRSDASVSKS